MSINLDELRNLARGAKPPPSKKKNNWGWFFLIIMGIICYQIFTSSEIDSVNNHNEVKYQQPDKISKEIARGDAVLSSQFSEKAHKNLSQNCYYVGAIKLRAREELTDDPNVRVKILNLGDKVCLHQEAPSPVANSRSIWYLVSKNDKYQGWVDGSYLLKDPVDLTDNLPEDWNEKTAELKSRIREYNLNN